MKINKFYYDAEGLTDMMFTADHLMTVYKSCNDDCDKCPLGKPILNNATTTCLVIGRVIKELKKEVYSALGI